MRSSAVVALALLSAAAPTVYASSPLQARHYPNTARRSESVSLSDYESGAFKLPAGAGGNILSLVASAAGAFSDLWPGNKRELESVLARALHNEFTARGDSLESGAFKLPAGAGGNILSLFASGAGVFSDLWSPGNKRELESLLARAYDTNEESGAWLGAAANIASLGSSAVSVFKNIFGGNEKQAREFVDHLMARAYEDDAESGAWLGAAANIASLGSSAVSVFKNLFGGNEKQARDFMHLMARADFSNDSASGALRLGTAADIASLGSSAVSIFKNLFGGNDQHARDFVELVARANFEDESGAIRLDTVANLASIGSSITSVFSNLFNRDVRPPTYSQGWPGRVNKFGNQRLGFPHSVTQPPRARSLYDLD